MYIFTYYIDPYTIHCTYTRYTPHILYIVYINNKYRWSMGELKEQNER